MRQNKILIRREQKTNELRAADINFILLSAVVDDDSVPRAKN